MFCSGGERLLKKRKSHTVFTEYGDKVVEMLKKEPMDRATIAEKLGIGVSAVLSLLDILEERGIVGSKVIVLPPLSARPHRRRRRVYYHIRRD